MFRVYSIGYMEDGLFVNGDAVSVRRMDCSSGFVVSLWKFSTLLGIMCPFCAGPSYLTVVCVDIGHVGDVDDGSIYGKQKKNNCLPSVSSFS